MRLAVTLLVGLQLLMPSGLCLCRQAQATSPHSPLPQVECDAAPKPKRCACKCKNQSTPVKSSAENVLNDDSATVPSHDSHEPGCPAVHAADYFFAVHSNEAISTLHFGTSVLFAAPAEFSNAVSHSMDCNLHAVRCPIYLTFATLLI